MGDAKASKIRSMGFSRNIKPDGNTYIKVVRGEEPWRYRGISPVWEAISDFENKEDIKSHPISGSEFDTMVEWLYESEAFRYGKNSRFNNIDIGTHDEFTTEEIRDKNLNKIYYTCLRSRYNWERYPANNKPGLEGYRGFDTVGVRIALWLK